MVDKVLLVSYEGHGNIRIHELFSLGLDGEVREVEFIMLTPEETNNELRLRVRNLYGIEINTNKVIPIPISMRYDTVKLDYQTTNIANYIKSNKRLMNKFYRPKVVK